MSLTCPLTVLCTGMLAADAEQGGAAWAVLQYVLGFRELGHRVYFVEPVASSKLSPSDVALGETETARRFLRLAGDFELTGHAALLLEGTTHTVGIDYETLRQAAKQTDVLLNISGMLTDPALLESIPRRVYLDLDPAFNQVWHATEGIDMRFDAHTQFATVGLALGGDDCPIPTCGREWIPTCPPVVLRYWPAAQRTHRRAFTTVANWRSYGSVHHLGVFLGQKAHTLRTLMDLPQKARARFELALTIHQDEPDLPTLRQSGWTLVDPRGAAGTPDRYRRFVRGSHAEIGIAKSGYVASRSGWFSDRSACYLASGRPVLAQDTGFGRALPTGEGLLTFSTEDEAIGGIEAIQSDYERHRRAARDIAVQHLDSNRVLTNLLQHVGAAA